MSILGYHSSPRKNYESIFTHGLKKFHPGNIGHWGSESGLLKNQHTGVFFMSTIEDSIDWVNCSSTGPKDPDDMFDIWEIFIGDYWFTHDKVLMGSPAYTILRDIPPSRLLLVKTIERSLTN